MRDLAAICVHGRGLPQTNVFVTYLGSPVPARVEAGSGQTDSRGCQWPSAGRHLKQVWQTAGFANLLSAGTRGEKSCRMPSECRHGVARAGVHNLAIRVFFPQEDPVLNQRNHFPLC